MDTNNHDIERILRPNKNMNSTLKMLLNFAIDSIEDNDRKIDRVFKELKETLKERKTTLIQFKQIKDHINKEQ